MVRCDRRSGVISAVRAPRGLIAPLALPLPTPTGRAVDLSQVLTGLDRESLHLMLAAGAHAAGSHQHRELLYGADGSFTGVR